MNWSSWGATHVFARVFSFPSVYELLPSYNDCCRIGDETKYTPFDPTDFAIWPSSCSIAANSASDSFAPLTSAAAKPWTARSCA
jgi:hypothetical protein